MFHENSIFFVFCPSSSPDTLQNVCPQSFLTFLIISFRHPQPHGPSWTTHWNYFYSNTHVPFVYSGQIALDRVDRGGLQWWRQRSIGLENLPWQAECDLLLWPLLGKLWLTIIYWDAIPEFKPKLYSFGSYNQKRMDGIQWKGGNKLSLNIEKLETAKIHKTQPVEEEEELHQQLLYGLWCG